jgi:hypothetical protein
MEFEWLGPAEYLDVRFAEQHTWSEVLLRSFDGGREGMGVEFRGRAGRTRPSEIIAANYTPDLGLAAAERAIGLTHADKVRSESDIRYFRFRTHHLWQPSATRLPVLLNRGDSLVEPSAVSSEGLDAAIRRIGDYLRYRRNRDGWFSYQFNPSADRYSDANSATAQMHALMALVAYARWSGSPEVRDAARGSISVVLPEVRALGMSPLAAASRPTTDQATSAASDAPASQAGLIVDFTGHSEQLETTARFVLAIQEFEDSGVSAGQYEGLLKGLLSAQDEDGRIEMLFSVAGGRQAEEFEGAGLAVRALSRDSLTSLRIEPALARAFAYYRHALTPPATTTATTIGPGPVAAGLLASGLAGAYARTNDGRMSDVVFSVCDRFVSVQLAESNCRWQELHGAIAARGGGNVGIDTAWYLSALAEGLRLADRAGDRERVKRYRAAVSAAARFVMQLEVREGGTFYVRTRRDALGGMRMRPWDSRIRIDHCAEALLALMNAREALFGGHRRTDR